MWCDVALLLGFVAWVLSLVATVMRPDLDGVSIGRCLVAVLTSVVTFVASAVD